MLDSELAKLAKETGYKNLKSMYFLHYLVKNIDPECVLELGTWLGGSAAYMAAAIKDGGIIVSIDDHKQLVQFNMETDRAKHNLQTFGLLNKVLLVEGNTHNVSELLVGFPNKPEIVFMDACHDYKGINKEFQSLISILPDNHIIVLDDLFSPVLTFTTDLIKKYPFCITIKQFHQGMAVVCTNSNYLSKISDAIVRAEFYD